MKKLLTNSIGAKKMSRSELKTVMGGYNMYIGCPDTMYDCNCPGYGGQCVFSMEDCPCH